MGREWHWGGGAKPSSTSNSSKRASERDSGQTTPSGCISAVFHLFDFHHLPFPSRHHHHHMGIQIKTSGDKRSKVGAPNNDTSSDISGSPGTKTPTLVARLMGLDLLPESCSPSFSSAPNFQAKSRLSHHIQPPKPGQSKTTGHRNSLDGDIRGTCSLPETPRISSARRSDVDHHYRLSLQINKDNMSTSEELVMSSLSSLKRKELKHEDENRSPGHYARQIVKQIKESVSGKVGMDITNTVRNREQAREELVSQFKYKKISRALIKVADDSSPGKHSTSSCSPKLRFLEFKSKPLVNLSTKDHYFQPPKSSFSSSLEIKIQPQPIRVLSKPKLQPVEEEQDEQHKQQKPPRVASECKKASSEKFGSRLKKPKQTSGIIRNKQEEPFVRPSTANRVNFPDKKCRKTPLSNDLLNITVPTLLPVKKDPSPPATKIPQKQVLDAQRPKRSSQFFSCSSQTYNKQEAEHAHVSRDNNYGDRCNDATTTTNTTTGDQAEYEYIARILRRTGMEKDTPVSFSSWFSPSNPLDPSIFYHLEHFTTCSTAILSNTNTNYNNNKTKSSQLSQRCNRKLLFHLVDEILMGILKPYFNMKPWVITFGHDFSHMDGSQLIDTLCSKIRSFPRVDCRVLEDIDALIDRDLPEIKFQSVMAYEEEGEGIVAEIEKDLLEALVHETVKTVSLWGFS
ncbi:uncharacterized protein LOC111302987 [Durio zibethinus]|uniref:Uncharacterized protein LOC111302987 n=1 Tax=Durio zibethinus TaxID=66656 RepID=A0A6P5ZP50_DURZI|nr:uncharacterized protein LOC111302987 [Durio zibethinus]